MARVRACNSENLKPGGIIESLLKIVNVLRMRPRLGAVHSDQPAHMATAESTQSALLLHLAKPAKRFCALKDFVCKWNPSLEVSYF